MLDENRVREIVKEMQGTREQANAYGVSLIPSHTHNGIDSQKISTDSLLNSRLVYVKDFVYTSSQTVVLNTIFTPRKLSAYSYAYNNVLVPNVICISQGNGDNVSAVSGICNSMQLSQDGTKAITYGMATFTDRVMDVAGFNSTVNVKIASWGATSITLTVTCAANWNIGIAVSITG